MRKITLACCLLVFTVIPGLKSFAQEASSTKPVPKAQDSAPAPSNHFYRLDFSVEELGPDGKAVNSRAYSTIVITDSHETMSIRTGSRFPIATGAFEKNEKEVTQFQYVDLGVNFDVREVREIGRQVSLNLSADLTGIAGQSDTNVRQPIIRHNRWQGICLIPISKAAVVFSSDSLDSKGSTRILVTATPLL
jgi:hypothetical protein